MKLNLTFSVYMIKCLFVQNRDVRSGINKKLERGAIYLDICQEHVAETRVACKAIRRLHRDLVLVKRHTRQNFLMDSSHMGRFVSSIKTAALVASGKLSTAPGLSSTPHWK